MFHAGKSVVWSFSGKTYHQGIVLNLTAMQQSRFESGTFPVHDKLGQILGWFPPWVSTLGFHLGLASEGRQW
jgi:hypothetical protein